MVNFVHPVHKLNSSKIYELLQFPVWYARADENIVDKAFVRMTIRPDLITHT
jgi:hypothetical protein